MRKCRCLVEFYNGGSLNVVVEAYTLDHAMDRAEAQVFSDGLSIESIQSIAARWVKE